VRGAQPRLQRALAQGVRRTPVISRDRALISSTSSLKLNPFESKRSIYPEFLNRRGKEIAELASAN
jgi:hypothetical protein